MRLKQQVADLFRAFAILCKDESFLKAISKIENFVSKILAITLVFVIFIALLDLLKLLTVDLFFTDPKGVFTAPLLKIFGMFLNVLIALELMENVTAYLRQHVIQLELVIITALTAVARKIVIFDSKSEGDLTGLAIAVLSLSISYWIVRSQNIKYKG
ncbi:phosphate-starvation-inducible PsiE family protein [Pseudanabaena sp. FACHB-1998]|uniref:phosphate-starvation-inducible PsiE family protein n=1 Tax=Pseudanabaena sp. FACHB-1998 TaxID=2692858 RepID=UPI0016816403|nr:phosphate-starvation-inducible PsiE family protein [Pseudanabaena sp. FACHB-1998]MBD2176214.1 phosphate-starvation-inducible PsiE family protein [Pseudanabaena sp. FACHB-1998]